MSEKLITFVVPCYNSQDYMKTCIDSLLSAGERAEILIVNDGSTDRTAQIAADYEGRFPDICRVLTQENGGHGEGINHGLREVAGKYFKVVDSDDWLGREALAKMMSALDECEEQGGVDLMVCNYVYDHCDAALNRTIRYGNVFPENRIFTWADTKNFLPWQYITMHSSCHRTQVLRDLKVELPKHTSYEDNLFVYLSLPGVKTLYYMNEDLYHYFIGREDQSVSEANLKVHCAHQIRVSSMIFKAYRLDEIKKQDAKLAKYMYHEMVFMMTIATIFTRMNRSSDAEQMVKEMWEDLSRSDRNLARKVRRASMAAVMNLPGPLGRDLGILCYRASHRFVAFN